MSSPAGSTRIVVIGNGMVGHRFVEALLQAQPDLPAAGLDRVAELAVTTPYPNPRPLEQAALRSLLQRAFDGQTPQP